MDSTSAAYADFCKGCIYGKSRRKEFPWKVHRVRAEQIGDLVHTDICGSVNVVTPGGANYKILFKDDSSGFRIIYCIKQKSEAITCMKKFLG